MLKDFCASLCGIQVLHMLLQYPQHRWLCLQLLAWYWKQGQIAEEEPYSVVFVRLSHWLYSLQKFPLVFISWWHLSSASGTVVDFCFNIYSVSFGFWAKRKGKHVISQPLRIGVFSLFFFLRVVSIVITAVKRNKYPEVNVMPAQLLRNVKEICTSLFPAFGSLKKCHKL